MNDRRGIHVSLAVLTAFLIPLAHGLSPTFVYDAEQYWEGAAALVAGHSPIVPGSMLTRGVFTGFVYVPPALVTSLIGPEAAAWTVLAWNAALGAVVAALLIPRIATLVSPRPGELPPISHVWVSAVIGGSILSGFARFSLVDVWSAAFALAGIYGLVVGRRWWTLSLAGVSIAIAANLRPAQIAPVLLAVAVLLVVRARPVAIAAPAFALAALPQVILNRLAWGGWSLVPRETLPLSAVQAAPATYTLRYDTVAFDNQDPRQWYCDPNYAKLVASDKTAHSQLDVVVSAAHHLPDSIWFLFRKAAANLSWSFETPYGLKPDAAINPLMVLVIAVSALGVAALVLRAIRSRPDRMQFITTLALLAFWFGALATLVFSTPETRFALPLVLIGLVGVVAAVPERLQRPALSRGQVIALVCGVLLASCVLLAGSEAMRHNMPPGPLANAAACANQ